MAKRPFASVRVPRFVRFAAIWPVFLSVLCGDVFANEAVKLILSSDKQAYVTREPVKLTVRMQNSSNETLRIPSIEYLAENMEYMYYEVMFPDGEQKYRHFRLIEPFRLKNPDYEGEVFKPGDTVVIFLYPNVTRAILPTIPGDRHESTFEEPGEYRIRVFYHVPEFRRKLWRPASGSTASNWITVNSREPTAGEQEILAVIWLRGFEGPAAGDNRGARFDEDALRGVIAAYPDEPLIKHAYLALTKELRTRVYRGEKEQLEAAQILEMMTSKYPEFRYEEVRLGMALAYWRAGEKRKAVRIFDTTLRERPDLKSNFMFMSRRLIVKYQGNEAFLAWKRSRFEGKPLDESKFEQE